LHTVIMQVQNGTQLRALLDYLRSVGIGGVIFPGREYGSRRADAGEAHREPEYATVPLLPRGNDGGFAEQFLRDRAKRS
jgi:hypothetical protein